MQVKYPSIILAGLSILSGSALANAQSIVPANDGTGTIVTPEGDRFNIQGGQRSNDGANLFHSFTEFGLDRGQVANFLSTPDIQNIFGRVTGGNVSYIDGLIQVTGGNSNLYLMNPAGILFGDNASLNVPADFTATTATGIGLGDRWFNNFGDHPWSELVGNPTAFDFATSQPGTIVNTGNLAVAAGRNLNVLGGIVLNTGTLQSPGGNLTVIAVPGENLVRLSAAGNVLSLDVSPNSTVPFAPLSLPELLTGGDNIDTSHIAVLPNGKIVLEGSGLSLDPQTGDAIVSGQLSASGATSAIQVLGNRVALLGATIDASGTNGGGNLFIGGDFQGNGTIPNAQQTFVDSQTSIFADALQAGNGGQVFIWADETTVFNGNLSARGGSTFGNGGFAEVSGKNTLQFSGYANLSAANGTPGTLLLDPVNITIDRTLGNSPGVDALLPDILFGDLDLEVLLDAATLEALDADVVLEATNNITIAEGIS